MISIIISTYQPTYCKALHDNIAETIGDVDYEVISIDNPGIMGICEAYNTGAKRARYPYLCFVHEDVLFQTPNWGLHLIAHFDDPDVGAIGVAGSAYKSYVPTTWSVFKPYIAMNLIQHFKASGTATQLYHIQPDTNTKRYQVVTLDGVFMATRQSIWQQYPFDTKTFDGFHGYDMDFSLQIGAQHSLFVVFDILLEHFSEGSPNKDWMAAAMAVSTKWKAHLPKHCMARLSETDQLQLEAQAKTALKNRLKRFGYTALYRKLLYLKYL
ncbi:glycosyltransferase [Bizionia hallyeonensis]|uniref:Glycosyltransferase n=1 Tax=Bizionia hallyeonensis TaxID=1123757 RepID=A0ABW0C5Y6_9FLAO